MPELPEVETIRRGIEKKIINKKIIGIEVVRKESVKNNSIQFAKELINNFIIDTQRKGKLLIMELKNKKNLIARLGMTGQLIYSAENQKRKHTRIIIYFKDRTKLYFNDIRLFGYMKIIAEKELNDIKAKMGIDPVEKNFTANKFKQIIGKRKRILKSLLLDQKLIAGIGNIYADEICFEAKLIPARKVNTLSGKEIKKLYNSIIKILRLAINNRGTSFSNYVDSNGKKGNFSNFLKVYQKEKEYCRNCKNRSIKKITVAGRSTRYCASCQK